MVEYEFQNKGSVLHLTNSYLIPKKEFEPDLKEIKSSNPREKIFERSINSLKKEWATHNFCYMVHYKRAQTKDCDLDNPCDKPEWVYKLVGTLVWPFIK